MEIASFITRCHSAICNI